MIDLDPQRVIEMPSAELGVVVLRDLLVSRDWSQWNYINEAQQGRYRGEPANAISGALGSMGPPVPSLPPLQSASRLCNPRFAPDTRA